MNSAEQDPVPARRRFLRSPLFHLVAAILLVALFQGFVAKLFVVPTGSMQPTIEVGERIIVDKTAFRFNNEAAVKGGDVVVFRKDVQSWEDPESHESSNLTVKNTIKFIFGDLLGIGPTREELLVKRVIATEGQVVECCSSDFGQMLVDGKPIEEPYIFQDLNYEVDTSDCSTSPRSKRCLPTVTVPAGKMLVLGDHRQISDDGATNCRSGSATQSADCYRWVDRKDLVGKAAFKIWPLSSWGPIN